MSLLAVVRRSAWVATLLSVTCCTSSAADPGRGFSGIGGWVDDDHAAGFRTFRTSCRPLVTDGGADARGAMPASAALLALCRAALAGPQLGRDEARRFFETWFDPVPVAAPGFLTGYYEPELAGSLVPSSAFPAPLLAPPDGLEPLPAGTAAPPGLEGLTAARRTSAGLQPLPDRTAIEAGALGAEVVPVVHLADPVDAFTVHVQGSARIRLPDGRAVRVGFAGRNGHPYTSVGRVLARELDRPPAEMTADRVFAWLKAHPERGADIMRQNKSFIFFRLMEAAMDGPMGAAGIVLEPGRSLAVDRTHWAYGAPIWLDGSLPAQDGGEESLRRLVVAQDTGAAIVGPARGDLFVGSGDEAGSLAGRVRHPVRFVALLPRAGKTAP